MQLSVKNEILAVHEQDLDSFLASLGLLEAFKNQELKCAVCGSVITKDNFHCVYPDNGEIKVCCSLLDCYKTVLKKLRKI